MWRGDILWPVSVLGLAVVKSFKSFTRNSALADHELSNHWIPPVFGKVWGDLKKRHLKATLQQYVVAGKGQSKVLPCVFAGAQWTIAVQGPRDSVWFSAYNSRHSPPSAQSSHEGHIPSIPRRDQGFLHTSRGLQPCTRRKCVPITIRRPDAVPQKNRGILLRPKSHHGERSVTAIPASENRF